MAALTLSPKVKLYALGHGHHHQYHRYCCRRQPQPKAEPAEALHLRPLDVQHFFDTFSTSEPPKVVREWCALYILTSKCASRHNGVHFFNISTSKSGPNLVCFVHFDLEMCFAPQRRALFQHRNFEKVVRTWCVLYILTSKCASRHNGVHFFDIATSKSGPELRCFVHFDLEMCFAPQRRAIFHLSSGQLAPHPPL